MNDRYLIARRLIEDSLRRHGRPVTREEVAAVLEKMPLPPVTRLAIAIADLAPDPDEQAILDARVEWRAHSLARNPFA